MFYHAKIGVDFFSLYDKHKLFATQLSYINCNDNCVVFFCGNYGNNAKLRVVVSGSRYF